MIHVQGKNPIFQWSVRGTEPQDMWLVGLWGDGRLSCNCPAFVYKMKHFCKHTQTKRLELEQLYGSVKNYIALLNQQKNG